MSPRQELPFASPGGDAGAGAVAKASATGSSPAARGRGEGIGVMLSAEHNGVQALAPPSSRATPARPRTVPTRARGAGVQIVVIEPGSPAALSGKVGALLVPPPPPPPRRAEAARGAQLHRADVVHFVEGRR